MVSDAPPELDELCIRLLRRKPEDDQRARNLAILGAWPDRTIAASDNHAYVSWRKTTPFVGRERQLRELEDASTSRGTRTNRHGLSPWRLRNGKRPQLLDTFLSVREEAV